MRSECRSLDRDAPNGLITMVICLGAMTKQKQESGMYALPINHETEQALQEEKVMYSMLIKARTCFSCFPGESGRSRTTVA